MPQSFIGIIVLAVFVCFVVFLISLDKKSSKKFQTKFENEHHVKDSYGDCFISNEGEFILNLPSGTLVGYKVWKLSDIAFIATARNQFTILDEGNNALKGEYLTPSKKPLKEKAYKTFTVKTGQNVDEVANLILRNANHVKQMKGGKVV